MVSAAAEHLLQLGEVRFARRVLRTAEAEAGSSRNFLRMKGSMEPAKVPHRTTPMTEEKTVRAMANQ